MSAQSRVAKKRIRVKPGSKFISILQQCVLLLVLLFTFTVVTFAKTAGGPRLEDYEGRLLVSIELAFENSPPDSASQAEFLSLLRIAAGTPSQLSRFEILCRPFLIPDELPMLVWK